MNTTGRILAVVLVLQVLTLAGQWLQPRYVAPAAAQVPDAGAQRLEMIQQLRAMNEKMDKLVGIFESGKLQVQVVTPDEN